MKKNILLMIDYLGLILIALFSAGYSILTRPFAQRHIDLPFLNFPIFMGELLFAFCLMLVLLKGVLGGIKFEKKDIPLWIGLGLYCLFVGAKVAYGFCHHGPLALRNAALFYYPFFAVFTAIFFNAKCFNKVTMPLMLIFLLGSIIVRPLNCYVYFMFTFVILTAFLILQLKSFLWRSSLLLTLILFTPYLLFFSGSRAQLLGFFGGILVIIALSLVIKMPKAKLQSGFLFFVSFCVLILLIMKFARKEELKSFTGIRQNIESYREANAQVAQARQNYKPVDLPVSVYQEDLPAEDFSFQNKIIESDTLVIVGKIQQSIAPTPIPVPVSAVSPINHPAAITSVAPTPAVPTVKVEPASEPVNNAIWRLFVWRDMLEEVWATNPFWGVDFGKPFISPSIVSMGWNNMEIKRVGWIEPHNSYVHVIYRSGVLGIGFILILFFLVFQTAGRFVKERFFSGVLLLAIMAYWLIVANFLVCFELPFFAIPFWSLFGLSYAYGQHCQPQKVRGGKLS